MWRGPGIGKLLVFITPFLDESTSNCAHHAQKEAEKQNDIDANGATWGAILAIAWLECLVYFDDERCDDGREQSVLQGNRKRLRCKSAMRIATHQENHRACISLQTIDEVLVIVLRCGVIQFPVCCGCVTMFMGYDSFGEKKTLLSLVRAYGRGPICFQPRKT